jgi:hypothetical protein
LQEPLINPVVHQISCQCQCQLSVASARGHVSTGDENELYVCSVSIQNQ